MFNVFKSGAQAIVLTFDLIDKDSLYNTKRWLDDVVNVLKNDEEMPFIFLVGTKKDLLVRNLNLNLKHIYYTNKYFKDLTSEMNRQQTELEASTFAKQINAEYWPVSSLNGSYLFD